MKRLCLPLILVLASACAVDYSPIRITGVLAADPKCQISSGGGSGTGETVRGQGTIDLALTTSYVSYMGIVSDLAQVQTTVQSTFGVETLSNPSANDFVVHEFTLKYSSVPAGSYPDQVFYKYYVVPAGSQSGNTVFVQLIDDQLGKQLQGQVPAGSTEPLQLFVTARASGTTLGGQSITSNPVTFPIKVYHSAPCPAGKTGVPSTPGTCGNDGQDGSFQVCQ